MTPFMTPKRIKRAVELRSQNKTWDDVAKELGSSVSTVRHACCRIAKKDPVVDRALKRAAREGNRRGAAKQSYNHVKKAAFKRSPHRVSNAMPAHISRVASPETLDQKLTGTPTACRSALKDFETDGRGNVTKREPSFDLPPISIQSVSINNNHT